MLAQFRKKLEHAEGRSEFVIAVICDIRGFSAFSTSHESPDTAMFIKRFYLTLLDDYFTQGVHFFLPVGGRGHEWASFVNVRVTHWWTAWRTRLRAR